MTSQSGGPRVLYSEVESRRFGLRVFRHTADTFDPQSLQEQIADNRVDVAICRVPAIYLSALQQLEMPFFVGDIQRQVAIAGRPNPRASKVA